MSQTAYLKLEVAKGEDVLFEMTHVTSIADQAPVDISGWTIEVTILNRDGSAFLTPAGTLVDGPTGQYSWSLTHTQTDVAPEIKTFDVWRTDSGSLRRMATGLLSIVSDARYGS